METRVNYAPPIYRVKKQRKFPFKKIIIASLVLLLGYLALFLLVVPERPDKLFFEGERPFVIAQRGGSTLAPENTIIAFEKARSIGVDIIDMDVHMTKDGHLVVIHDEEVDRTTNGKGYVNEFTLKQLQELDAGYTYKDIKARAIYRGQDVKVPTVAEVFEQVGDMRFSIEMKAPPKKHTYTDMEKKLWELINRYEMEDQVFVFSTSQKMMDSFNKLAKGNIAVGASKDETQRFVLYHKLFLNRLYKPKADGFQAPVDFEIFNLDDSRIVKGARKLNMGLFFEGINTEEEMRELLAKGASGIVTERPDLLIRVMNEMEDFNE
jgi:glycerophosphoryl diester phosphodiesterase